jgi:hypothetical protein
MTISAKIINFKHLTIILDKGENGEWIVRDTRYESPTGSISSGLELSMILSLHPEITLEIIERIISLEDEVRQLLLAAETPIEKMLELA